jgi:hypothetical protein
MSPRCGRNRVVPVSCRYDASHVDGRRRAAGGAPVTMGERWISPCGGAPRRQHHGRFHRLAHVTQGKPWQRHALPSGPKRPLLKEVVNMAARRPQSQASFRAGLCARRRRTFWVARRVTMDATPEQKAHRSTSRTREAVNTPASRARLYCLRATVRDAPLAVQLRGTSRLCHAVAPSPDSRSRSGTTSPHRTG